MYGFSALKCTAWTSSSILAVVSEIVWRSKPVMGKSLGVSGEKRARGPVAQQTGYAAPYWAEYAAGQWRRLVDKGRFLLRA
jgi:hypothetical protein